MIKKAAAAAAGVLLALIISELVMQLSSLSLKTFQRKQKPASVLSEHAYTIQCLGDSVTEGFSVRPYQNYPAVLKKLLSKRYPVAKVINSGHSGANTHEILQAFFREDSAKRIDMIIFLAGINNLWNSNGYIDYLKNRNTINKIKYSIIPNLRLVKLFKILMKNDISYEGKRISAQSSPREINKIRVLIEEKKNQEAKEKLLVITSNKADWEAYQMLADTFAAQKEHINALKNYKKSWALNPYRQYIYSKIGDTLVVLNRKKEALKWFRKGIERYPYFRDNYSSYIDVMSEKLNTKELLRNLDTLHVPRDALRVHKKFIKDSRKFDNIKLWISSDIKKLKAYCDSKGILLIVADYPNYPSEELKFLKDLSLEENIPYADVNGCFSDLIEKYGFEKIFNDPIHPNALGYTYLASFIEKFIVSRDLIELNTGQDN